MNATKMGTTEIMRKDSVEEIVAHRDRAMALYRQADELMCQANAAATQALLSARPGTFSPRRETIQYLGKGDDERFMSNVRKELDANVWRHLFQATGLGDLFDSKRLKQFHDQLEKDPPIVSEETIMATAFDLASKSGDIFAESVEDLFKRLSHYFKSHSGVGFGERLIFSLAMHMGWLGEHTHRLINDLERIVYMLDGKPAPERYGGLYALIKNEQQDLPYEQRDTGVVENEYFKAKWYKNGNLHIWLKRPDITEKMNLTLAAGHGDKIPFRPHG